MKSESPKSVILSNIPNLLTICRIILTFVVMYSIFTGAQIIHVVILFSVAAITDLLDGQLARRFHWESEFGRKADIIADRFLWIGTAFAFMVVFGRENEIKSFEGVQLLLIMAREIITAPFALIALFARRALPKVRYIGKATTVLQGFALPSLILSTTYPLWTYAAVPLALAAGVTGFLSAMYYIKDIKPHESERKNERTRKG